MRPPLHLVMPSETDNISVPSNIFVFTHVEIAAAQAAKILLNGFHNISTEALYAPELTLPDHSEVRFVTYKRPDCTIFGYFLVTWDPQKIVRPEYGPAYHPAVTSTYLTSSAFVGAAGEITDMPNAKDIKEIDRMYALARLVPRVRDTQATTVGDHAPPLLQLVVNG